MLEKQQAWSEQSFNSMKVRLKQELNCVLVCAAFGFNSMKVRLKPDENSKANYAAKFQFHEGPIKATSALSLVILMFGFNSMKVRLKLHIADKHRVRLVQFQFHEGPIKAADSYCDTRPTSRFNSMKVRLKQVYCWQYFYSLHVSIP